MMVFMFFKLFYGFLRFFTVFMGLCFVGPVGLVVPWVGLACGSGGPLGLVGLWVCWWACGSDGLMGQVDLVVC